MKPERITVDSFCLIGKPGSTEEGPDTVARLWREATEQFSQVAPLAKKNAQGQPVGFWGAMTRMDMSFLPWEEDFSKGRYMAGVEAEEDAIAPEGWKKWIVPGFECWKIPVDSPTAFRDMLEWMKENGQELVAAVQDFTDPATGKNYMLFPVAWNDSKRDLIRRQKEKTAPIAYCGFHCNNCFMTEWCGNCRSACNMCSYATLFPDNRCENEKCCTEKGLDGCYECGELAQCGKGFYGSADGSVCKACAMFVSRYGKAEYDRVITAEAGKEDKMKAEYTAEENLRILEGLR